MVSLYCMFCIFRAQYIVTITTAPPVALLHRRPPIMGEGGGLVAHSVKMMIALLFCMLFLGV